MSILEIVWVLTTLILIVIGIISFDYDADASMGLFIASFWSIVFMFIYFDFLTTKLW